MTIELRHHSDIAAKILAASILFAGVIALYARRMSWIVAEEYRLGSRTCTDGDSLGIPIGTFGLGILGAFAAVWLLRTSLRGGLSMLRSLVGIALIRRAAGIAIGIAALLISASWLAWAIGVAL